MRLRLTDGAWSTGDPFGMFHHTRRFAREISQLCAYDTAQMGQVVSL